MIQMNLFKNINIFTDIENKLMVTKGEHWNEEGINYEFGIKIYT